ncbi:MAG: M48 family metallopeptidase [Gammaproteobacteria bacterium]|nr:M48 family metallopeptidase [Gammaproteobacteria bacterium]
MESGEFKLDLPQSTTQITFNLIVSLKRKSISLELKQGNITVRSPYWLTHSDIEQFVQSKERWLLNKLALQTKVSPLPHQYENGTKLLFDGQFYELTIQQDRAFKWQFDHENKQLLILLPTRVTNQQAYIKRKLIELYTELAQSYVLQRTHEIEKRMKLKCQRVEFKVYKRRWGCCYSSGLIRINPLIMGAPKWVVDCVLTHELSHLVHMDHSKAFWQLNEQFCDHCKNSKQWLKQHSHYLQLN